MLRLELDCKLEKYMGDDLFRWRRIAPSPFSITWRGFKGPGCLSGAGGHFRLTSNQMSDEVLSGNGTKAVPAAGWCVSVTKPNACWTQTRQTREKKFPVTRSMLCFLFLVRRIHFQSIAPLHKIESIDPLCHTAWPWTSTRHSSCFTLNVSYKRLPHLAAPSQPPLPPPPRLC